MKKILTNNLSIILTFILSIVLGGVVAYAGVVSVNGTDVTYNSTNVESAIDDLYTKANQCNKTDMYRVFKFDQTANVVIYDGNNNIVSGTDCTSGIENNACVGNWKFGTWKRLSYANFDNDKYYETYFKIKIPDNINYSNDWILGLTLDGNYTNSSNTSSDIDFRIYNQKVYFYGGINCYSYKGNGNPYYLINKDDNAKRGSWIWVSCGIKDGYIYVNMDSSNDQTSGKVKYSILTRGDAFKMKGVLFHR